MPTVRMGHIRTGAVFMKNEVWLTRDASRGGRCHFILLQGHDAGVTTSLVGSGKPQVGRAEFHKGVDDHVGGLRSSTSRGVI